MLGQDKKGDVVNKRELPNAEFQDFLSTYDETMWQRPEEEKKEDEANKLTEPTLTHEIEIKEEEDEGSELSEDEADQTKLDSPLSNGPGSDRPSMIGEGDGAEETFMSLDEALELES